ncbi:NAD(P)/FAD-dependent oxidoreductase [Streptomyces sp. NPDC002306]
MSLSARNAAVLGGGIAGMLTTVALLGHVENVAIVERDDHCGPAFRKGVPQARHQHLLLSAGQRALETLLPGIGAALVAAGAHRLEMPRDLLTCTPFGWQRRYHEDRHAVISLTRPLLDHIVRERVLAEARKSVTRIELVEHCDAVGLLGDARKIAGVRVRPREARDTFELASSLVIDASGRSSRCGNWLEQLGCKTPEEERFDTKMAYATRLFRLPEPPDASAFILVRPDCPRGGAMVPVEEGLWIVTQCGLPGHQPGTGETEFLDFLNSLADPYIYDAVKNAEAVTPVFGFRETANRRRHYDATNCLPEGFAVVADAACQLNPIHGQGVSVAAQGIVALQDAITRHGTGPGFTSAAQNAISRSADEAWLAAIAADRPWIADSSSSASLIDRVQGWYTARLYSRATVDPFIGRATRDVMSLTAPLRKLTSPAIALRTIFLPRRTGLPTPPLRVENRG